MREESFPAGPGRTGVQGFAEKVTATDWTITVNVATLVVAVLGLMPDPTQVITARQIVEDHQDAWQVLALDKHGVVVGTAKAPGHWDWGTSDDPSKGSLTARWYPMDCRDDVRITDVSRWSDGFHEGSTLTVHETWAVTIAGQTFALGDRSSADEGLTPADFAGALMAARSAAK